MFVPGLVIALISLIFLYHAWGYRQIQKTITEELADEAGKLIEQLNSTGADLVGVDAETEMMKSPKYLATLCTVLVKKSGGSIRLTEQDFMDLSEEDYISIYVDVNDASIVLCLNSLADTMLAGDDDPVFH
tara:strand:+ start:506 stop:898 length:393 start_codon:yes stop_codon:yes gene_type:complete